MGKRLGGARSRPLGVVHGGPGRKMREIDVHSAGADSARVAARVRCVIDLDGAELSDEFFPGHLSIAVIDAVFNPQLRYESQVIPIIDSYCRHFEIRRIRPSRGCTALMQRSPRFVNMRANTAGCISRRTVSSLPQT